MAEIFRQEAVDRMASPDRVDQPLRLVRPANWVFLAAAAAVILFALIWGLTTSVPISIEARGILLGSNGLSEIAAEFDGRVEEILVQPGERVEAGQVVARLSSERRGREVRAAEAGLSEALASASTSENVYRSGESSLTTAERSMTGSIDQRTAELRRQLVTRQQTVDSLRRLIDQNAATNEELADVMSERDELLNEIRDLEQQRLDIGVSRARRSSERGQTRLGENQLVAQRRRELAMLRAQASEETVLRAPEAGEVVEVKVNRGDILAPGDSVATIDTRSTGGEDSRRVEAVFYATPAEGKRVAAGMRVEIVPTTVEREIYGHILGEVASVTTFPASRQAMRRYLQNDQLVEELSASGAPIEIRVRMQRADNPSGFAWSSSNGPGWAISRGTLLDGKVVLEKRPVLDVLLPGIRGRVVRTEPVARESGNAQ